MLETWHSELSFLYFLLLHWRHHLPPRGPSWKTRYISWHPCFLPSCNPPHQVPLILPFKDALNPRCRRSPHNHSDGLISTPCSLPCTHEVIIFSFLSVNLIIPLFRILAWLPIAGKLVSTSTWPRRHLKICLLPLSTASLLYFPACIANLIF